MNNKRVIIAMDNIYRGLTLKLILNTLHVIFTISCNLYNNLVISCNCYNNLEVGVIIFPFYR